MMKVRFKKMHFTIVLIVATLALALTVGLDVWHDRNILKINNFIIALAVLYGLIGLIVSLKNEKKND